MRGRRPVELLEPAAGAAPLALAEELELLLAVTPFGGRSCDELALELRRRRADVLEALRSDPRFAHEGRTRGSRWRLARGLWDGMGRNHRWGPDAYHCPPGGAA